MGTPADKEQLDQDLARFGRYREIRGRVLREPAAAPHESLVIRYDAFGRRWGPENRDEAHKHTVMNLINRIARVTIETFSETVLRDFDGTGFEPWTAERAMQARMVPGCVKEPVASGRAAVDARQGQGHAQ